jgi:hypothetical protein
MSKPTEHHLDLAYRILSYVTTTQQVGLTFSGQHPIELYATADASYATHDDRKSHLGYTIHLGNPNASSYTSSKKSKLVALSSTEAVYMALFECAKSVMWARQFLTSLGFPQNLPTPVAQDNMSTISISNSGNDMGRTRHMDIRFHYVKDCVSSKLIYPFWVPTSDMTSDILSKPLAPTPFHHLSVSLLSGDIKGGC